MNLVCGTLRINSAADELDMSKAFRTVGRATSIHKAIKLGTVLSFIGVLES